jgi:hypothetical protein
VVNFFPRVTDYQNLFLPRLFSHKDLMFSFLKKDPMADLESKRKKLLEEAMHIQRSGDLRRYTSAILPSRRRWMNLRRLAKKKR